MTEKTVFVQMSEWNRIRRKFNQSEKAALNRAICGEVVCPAAIFVDATKVGLPLKEKLVCALEELRSGGAAEG